jgi:polyisoprenoid-binding protein YceI
MLKNIIFFSSLVLFTGAVQAAPTSFKIIPDQSSIKFEVQESGSTLHGEFKKFDADIKFDPNELDKSSAKVTIDMGSVAVDDVKAKSDIKESLYLNVKGFPQAVFETTAFRLLGDKRYEAAANLTIKGHSEPVKLVFTLQEFSKDKAYMTGEITLKRTVFKVGDEDTSDVGDDVKVLVVVRATGVK